MSCYVDPLFVMESNERQAFSLGKKYGHRWCHLWADTPEELHAMATKIGMKRAWFQNKPTFPHYDLVPPRRAAAVRAGAIEFPLSEWRRGMRPGAAYTLQNETKEQLKTCTKPTQLTLI